MTIRIAAILLAAALTTAGASSAPATAAHRDEIGWMEILSGDLAQFPGVVLCAPHADFDEHTGEVVRRIHEQTQIPAVLAWDYRRRSDLVWFDVNRPCTRLPVSGELEDLRRQTPQALRVYETYQRLVYEAAGVEEPPVDLHIEIHGFNATHRTSDGSREPVNVIEAAATGFTDEEVRRISSKYSELAAKHGLTPITPLFFLQTDPYYEVAGEEINFHMTAEGARQLGALRPECTRRSLHFELPRSLRLDESKRLRVAELFSELILWVTDEFP